MLLAIAALSGSVNAEVRRPAVAGTFYPADSATLSEMVRGHLAQVHDLPEIDGHILALIVPHAGLVYSGAIAACSFKLLERSGVNRVVLCGPSHRHGFNGASVYGPGIRWRTPLGTIECDDTWCRKLLGYDNAIDIVREAHAAEHSLEVQLPYLQTVLPAFKIVPIVFGYPEEKTIETLAAALSSLPDDPNSVMIVSTDWQHYKPASVGRPMDSLGIACIENLDAERLLKHLADGRVEMCGGAPAVAVMKAALTKGANRAKLLCYGDSGDLTGDKSAVVGYAAIAIYRSGSESNSDSTDAPELKTANSTPNFDLSDADKKQLLRIARESISIYLKTRAVPEFDVPENLRQPGAAFVTLEKRGRLRGCIGHTMAIDQLYKTVATCAIQAAFADRRFHPVQTEELPQLHIEISVLTPLVEVRSLDEIEVGRHGLMIVMGNSRGLLLPQVATDYGWSRTQFLQQTCQKAGLPTDAYQSPEATIYKYEALIFGE
jgi:AmmeMemoRadiSam system protein B/AmmeMemoRadiSam system protein A